jgi:hypothetical protein
MAEALTDALEAVEVTPPAEVAVQSEEDKTYLNNLVGEGKKFAKDEALAKAYHHANLHIEELKSDLDVYKDGKELLNEVLDEIRNTSSDESTDAPAPQQAPAEAPHQKDDVAKLVSEEFSKKEREALQRANVKDSLEKLSVVYGSEAAAKVAVTKTINGDVNIQAAIDSLSLKSPDAMVKFITGVTPAETIVEGNTPGVDAATPPSISGVGLTWEQCRQIRKEDPRRYKSAEFRQSIQAAANAAAANGVDFFAT